jgi:hypothetical protein
MISCPSSFELCPPWYIRPGHGLAHQTASQELGFAVPVPLESIAKTGTGHFLID